MTEAIEATLTWAELHAAVNAGAMRQLRRRQSNSSHRNNMPMQMGWSSDIEGAAGEMAFAKYLNVYWIGHTADMAAPDVAGCEVRAASEHHHRLWFYDTDKDDRPYVLLTGLAPRFIIRGWMMGCDGKQYDKTDPGTGRPARWVPQRDLSDMASLKQHLGMKA